MDKLYFDLLKQMVSVRNLLVRKDNASKKSALEILASVNDQLNKNISDSNLCFYLLAAYGDAFACAHGQDDFKSFSNYLNRCVSCLGPEDSKRFAQERETDEIETADYTATKQA